MGSYIVMWVFIIFHSKKSKKIFSGIYHLKNELSDEWSLPKIKLNQINKDEERDQD